MSRSRQPRWAAVSVDLDEIDCYAAIHGLGLDAPARAASRHAIYDRALPRLEQLFEELQVPASFFAIGRDLQRAENAAAVRRLVQRGHEVANHSMHHLYDLTRRDLDTQRREVREGADAIEAATGVRPVGFRAPGYTVDDRTFEALAAEGVRYDSSAFPCPFYYSAKALAIGWIRLRGRRSQSVVDDPRVLRAPADPYAVGRPYWRRGAGLLELPIGVTRGLRLPYIGTFVVMGGERGARQLTRQIAGRPLVSLELHGIDASDADADQLTWLRPHQHDLRRRAEQKLAALRAAVEELRSRGYQFVTCAQAAERFLATCCASPGSGRSTPDGT